MGRRTNPRGRGSRRAPRGAVRDAILIVLAERPMHGYELMTELEARSSGRWRPSPGSIYPALTRMEEQGLITADVSGDKKVFALTEHGQQKREALDIDDPTPDLWRNDEHGALRALPAEIAGQARQVRRFGSPDQVERAANLLEQVKRELYAILANGPAPDKREHRTDD